MITSFPVKEQGVIELALGFMFERGQFAAHRGQGSDHFIEDFIVCFYELQQSGLLIRNKLEKCKQSGLFIQIVCLGLTSLLNI